MEARNILANNLKLALERKSLKSQAQAASALGIAQTQISNLLNGRKSVQLDSLERLSDALESEVWELLLPPEVQTVLNERSGRDLLEGIRELSEKDREAVWQMIQKLYSAGR